VSEVDNIKRMLKAWETDYKNGRLEASVYLRMKNSYETALKQAQDKADGK